MSDIAKALIQRAAARSDLDFDARIADIFPSGPAFDAFRQNLITELTHAAPRRTAIPSGATRIIPLLPDATFAAITRSITFVLQGDDDWALPGDQTQFPSPKSWT